MVSKLPKQKYLALLNYTDNRVQSLSSFSEVSCKVVNSLVLWREQVDRPLLSGFTPVWLVHLHHLLDAETQTLEERGRIHKGLC